MYGINLGSYNIGISHFIESSIKILLSLSSNRTFRNIITNSCDNERYYGDLAMLSYFSNIEKTIFSPQRLLSDDIKNIELECLYSNEDFNLLKENENIYDSKYFLGLVTILTKISNDIEKDIKDQMQINNGRIINKAFLTVSIQDFFSMQERLVFINAMRSSLLSKIPLDNYSLSNYEDINAHISKQSLKETILLNESSAITLYYGFDRRKELYNLKESRIVCFVDIGHSKSTVTFSSFIKDEFKVLYVSNNRNFGARNFDMSILLMIFEDFVNSNQLSINLKNLRKKSIQKLLDEITKARKILTVNNEANILVNNFFGEFDLSYNLKKENFVKFIEKDLELLKEFLVATLLEYKKKKCLSDIFSIELAGEAVRIPILQDLIEKIFSHKLSKTILPDEAIAKGCCIYSIMHSNLYSFNYDFKLLQYSNNEIYLEFPIKREKNNNSKNESINEDDEIYFLKHKILNISDSFPTRKVFKVHNPLSKLIFTFTSNNTIICKIF